MAGDDKNYGYKNLTPQQRDYVAKSRKADSASEKDAFNDENTKFSQKAGELSTAQSRSIKKDENDVEKMKHTKQLDDMMKLKSGDDSKSGSFVGSFRKGGKIKRTGIARVHKGERVLTKSQAARYGKGKA